jgi:hypothetical protein
MRTKILLTAAAALVAGLVSSNAQVYSANVVGYVQVGYPAGKLIFSDNPLTTGHDVLTNVLTSTTGSSAMYYWTGTSWASYTYSGPQKKWLSGAVDVSNTNLPPGLGFFIQAGGAGFTNTYVGSVVAATGGGKATNALFAGYQPVGEVVPYGDIVTNVNTVNLTVGGSSVLVTWNVAGQTYDPSYTYSGPQHVWKQGAVTANPTIVPGQAFWIAPTIATNWVQTLQ